jgi:glycosyltransferase involved in cell wall biosynthesis
MRVLFLIAYMIRGYGTTVVVTEIGRRLQARGHSVMVGCLDSHGKFGDLHVVETAADAASVRQLAESRGCSVVVAHTSPFFEVLPALSGSFDCWAFEAGDPTPELFDKDENERRRIVTNKQVHVYPNVRGVITISNFLRHDIGFPRAHVVPLGCDHMPHRETKSVAAFAKRASGIRIGTLARLGEGEARYKGFDDLIELKRQTERRGVAAQLSVMGRGTERDARRLRDNGIEVKLNGTEEEKAEYLRGLDVFVSLSLWEGFNLPLVEAASQGTVSIGYDVGAHPEVTPIVVANQTELLTLLEAYASDRRLLADHSRLCYDYVWQRFLWDYSAELFLAALGGARGERGRRL